MATKQVSPNGAKKSTGEASKKAKGKPPAHILAAAVKAKPALAGMLSAALNDEPNGGPDLLREILAADIDGPMKAPVPRFHLLTARDMLAEQEPVTWRIDKILAEETVNLWVGEPGAGKTWAAEDMAACVALSLEWIGHKTKGGPVLIVEEDSSKRGTLRRLHEVLRAHGAPADAPIYAIAQQRFDARIREDVGELAELILDIGARVVVIDTLAAICPGADENSVKDMQPVLLALSEIAGRTSAAIVLLHHLSKQGGYRGSTAIKGAVDTLTVLTRRADSNVIDFKIEKARDSEEFEYAAELHFDARGVFLTPAEPACKVQRLTVAENEVLDILADRGPLEVGAIKDAAAKCSPEKARQAVYSLASKGRIERVGGGGKGGAAATYAIKKQD